MVASDRARHQANQTVGYDGPGSVLSFDAFLHLPYVSLLTLVIARHGSGYALKGWSHPVKRWFMAWYLIQQHDTSRTYHFFLKCQKRWALTACFPNPDKIVFFFVAVCTVAMVNLNACNILEKHLVLNYPNILDPCMGAITRHLPRHCLEDQQNDLKTRWPGMCRSQNQNSTSTES